MTFIFTLYVNKWFFLIFTLFSYSKCFYFILIVLSIVMTFFIDLFKLIFISEIILSYLEIFLY